MAKPKGGLGKGLGSLFGESDAIYNQAPATEESSVDDKKAPTNKSNPAPQNPVPTNASEKPEVKAEVQEEKKETASVTAQKPSEIYFSDDALENARVVERVAKAPVEAPVKPVSKKPTTRQAPLKTAPIKPASSFSRTDSEKEAIKATEEKSDSSQSSNKSKGVGSVEAQAAEAAKRIQATKTEVKKPEIKEEKGAIIEVLLSDIEPNPEQPRTNFKPEEIEELASSIKQEGLLQPILVRKVNNKYQIIAGERRYQACLSLGLETVPVRFWMADNDKALELALVENIQRTDLNPIEEAYGYKRLMERRGMTQSEVAQTVSKGRSTIANALRLLDLPEEAQQLLYEEKITAGHARAILSIPTEEGRKKLTNKLMEEKLSVREAEAIANLLKGTKTEKEVSVRVPTPASFKRAARSLSQILSVPVRVKNSKGKNKIEIQFKDEDELKRILEVINGEKAE